VQAESCGEDGFGNGFDENCNGLTDEICECVVGDTMDCNTGLEGECHTGLRECLATGTGSMWGECLLVTTPTVEDCGVDGFGNGLDDDCDGQADEDCDCKLGEIRDCATALLGVCHFGKQTCVVNGNKTEWTVCQGPDPVEEDCDDGLDNDCDGIVNNGCTCDPTDPPKKCNTGLPGECAEGAMYCLDDGTGYTQICELIYQEQPESCGVDGYGNGLDDNCNGLTDEICECVEDDIMACSTGLPGVCNAGTRTCEPEGDGTRWSSCVQDEDPTLESCDPDGFGNGLDDNCDGQVDENCECDPDTSRVCTTDLFGLCHYGTQQCVQNGNKTEWGVCQAPAPVDEDCDDAIDNNCDGQVNEGCSCDPGTYIDCNTDLPGECAQGRMACLADGTGYTQVCEPIYQVQAESCGEDGFGNGFDENCNGLTDEICECVATV
jgi:hypothetical protein